MADALASSLFCESRSIELLEEMLWVYGRLERSLRLGDRLLPSSAG